MNLETSNAGPASGHLTSEEIAAYLDRSALADRVGVDKHIAECDECRRELLEVHRFLRGRRRRRAAWVMAPIAAAAGLAAILFLSPQIFRPAAPAGTLRSGPSVEATGRAPRVQALAPLDGEAVYVGDLHFTWRQAAENASYRLTLTSAEGDIVWTASGSDTTVELPAAVRLNAGRTYFWYVDALLPDGASLSSGAREFRIATSPSEER